MHVYLVSMAFGGKPFSRCNICSSQGTICYAMYLSPFFAQCPGDVSGDWGGLIWIHRSIYRSRGFGKLLLRMVIDGLRRQIPPIMLEGGLEALHGHCKQHLTSVRQCTRTAALPSCWSFPSAKVPDDGSICVWSTSWYGLDKQPEIEVRHMSMWPKSNFGEWQWIAVHSYLPCHGFSHKGGKRLGGVPRPQALMRLRMTFRSSTLVPEDVFMSHQLA